MQATTEKHWCNDSSSALSMNLRRCLLLEIRQKSGDQFVFQQDGVPSHKRSQPSSSCSVLCRTSLNRLYGPQQPEVERG